MGKTNLRIKLGKSCEIARKVGFLSILSSKCFGKGILFSQVQSTAGYKGIASIFTWLPVSFQGPEQQNWALAAIPSQTQLILLLELPRNSTRPKFTDTFPAALVFESKLVHEAVLVFCWIVLGVTFGFCFGGLFCDNGKPERCLWPTGGWRRIRGHGRAAAGGRQDVLCKLRCILY